MLDPSLHMRQHVRLLVFLEFTPERIAEHLDCALAELEEHFGYELRFARVEILAQAQENIRKLAAQRENPRVALKASRSLQDGRHLPWLAGQTKDLRVAFEANRLLETGGLEGLHE